jgi:hypothetical protein
LPTSERPRKGGSQVVVLGLQPVYPPYLIRSLKFGLSLFRKCQVVLCVALRESLRLPALLLEAFLAVLAHRLEHPEARHPFLSRLGCHQGLVHQLGEHLQHVAFLDTPARAHLFCCLKRPSPGKHR